jgi:hypothetical protein
MKPAHTIWLFFIVPLLLILIGFNLSGCAADPAVQVQGNGYCHPAQDLPAHKVVAPVPETATAMDDLYALLAAERKTHAADDRDYNSLFAACVGASNDTSVSPKQ